MTVTDDLMGDITVVDPGPAAAAPATLTRADAVRFLQRASFGGTVGEVDRLRTIGITTWLNEQYSLNIVETNASRMARHPSPTSTYWLSDVIWEGYLSDPAQLRKRISYAWSQIMVVGRSGLSGEGVTTYADTLETHCFSTFRQLLEAVTLSNAMGRWLTYNNNRKANTSGRVPDENFAREVMQLFTIGLWELNNDGTRKQNGGGDIATYTQDDVAGLARVFTGWTANGNTAPMAPRSSNLSSYYESGAKTFLGATIGAGASIESSLSQALDVLANHPNVGPFICRQLIQRLVTSNPSSSYLSRVVNIFNDDGTGQRGNLKAVYTAILTDAEAWPTTPAASFGKLREPVLRFSVVARALGLVSTEWPWNLSGLGDTATGLGQQPYDSASVFNFYRPGYVPPATAFADNGLTAPEFQIVDETTTIGWINFLSSFLRRPRSRMALTIDDLRAMSGDANALVDELAGRLVAWPLTPAIRTTIVNTVNAINTSNTDTRSLERVTAAASLIAASIDFLHER